MSKQVSLKSSDYVKSGWSVRPGQLGQFAWRIVRLIFVLGVSYVILFPLLTKISSSFMTVEDLYDQTVLWIPKHITFEHYKKVFEFMNYPIAFLNSTLLATLVSALQLATCTVVGYGFARFPARLNGLLFAAVVFTLIVPPQMVMIPLYLNFRYFTAFGLLPGSGVNLLGSYWPAILTSLTGTGLRNGLHIFIMRQFFRGMPRELEEAAYVDGAGPFTTFFRIMLPGALPAMVVVFLFSFVWQWNDYFFTTIFMGSKDLLTNNLNEVALRVLESAGLTHEARYGEYASLINNTGSLMFIAPLLILYAALQKYFIESIERTGLVG